MEFKLVSSYSPTGDQPKAIDGLVSCIDGHSGHVTLQGVTGSGKTFTVANAIERLQRPVLVLSHNKALAAQLYEEFRNYFPENAVEFFVSYYDYYQPEAYLPTTDTFIEKDLSINKEIEQMRLSATSALLSGRRDVIVVSSVSCLYGIGNPADFHATSIPLEKGEFLGRNRLLRSLVEAQYTRVENILENGKFRVNGQTVDIMSAFGSECYRVSFFDDEIEALSRINPDTGARIEYVDRVVIYPANLFVTTKEKTEKAIAQIQIDLGKRIGYFESEGKHQEAQRIKQRVEYDLEMIKELGYCSGIENYSRYLDGRSEGTRPFCLLDYFPEDYLMVVDESHVTLPQVRAMFGGDRSRKENLVNFGFRLPAAIDNRPLTFDEFESMTGQTVYVSATPGDYELLKSENALVEQVIRPTGLVDPEVNVRITENQIDDLVEDIRRVVAGNDRVLVTTLTKRMAEELSKYFDRIGIRNRYIHSDVDTLERVNILKGLRNNEFDVLIGVNLLREGLDLPEVSLVAIMDADKEGFLRNERSITQTSGRAARHARGRVTLYAEKITDSMDAAMEENARRRRIQIDYNNLHGQVPRTAEKNIATVASAFALYPQGGQTAMAAEPAAEYMTVKEVAAAIVRERKAMEEAALKRDFDAAAHHRDAMYAMEKRLITAEK